MFNTYRNPFFDNMYHKAKAKKDNKLKKMYITQYLIKNLNVIKFLIIISIWWIDWVPFLSIIILQFSKSL